MDTFDQWLAGRDVWLQTAASNLLETGIPDAKAICELADLCLLEETKAIGAPKKVPPGTFATAQTGKIIRLVQVRDLQAINALDPTANLNFGDANLTVIYGPNGSGKSGFARLLKLATGSRTNSPILRDINSKSEAVQQATFDILENGESSSITWTASTGPLAKLRQIHVFDTNVAKSYLLDKAEATYEPRRLRFLSALSDICDKVRDELRDRENSLVSKLPVVPTNLLQSRFATVPGSLKASDTADTVAKRIRRKEDHAVRRMLLHETVKTTDPSARLNQISISVKGIDGAISKLSSLESALSKDSITSLTESQKRATDARLAADTLAKNTLSDSTLPGVGSNAWATMWEAARDFMTNLTPQSLAFPPPQGSHCPLCQTVIDGHAAKRLITFEAFIKGKVESDARNLERSFTEQINKLPTIPSLEEWAPQFPVGGDLVSVVHEILGNALGAARRRDFVSLKANIDGQPITALRQALTTFKAQLLEESNLLTISLDASGLAALQGELSDLLMLDWCHDNLQAILGELERVKSADTIRRASKRTNTSEITKKKNALAKEELIGGYQDRFVRELRYFGAQRISVAPNETSGAKGKVKFLLSIQGSGSTPLDDILSEGEARIVALANFLADTSISPITTPFIFDDPVSSLDVEFEERVSRRLVELAKERQVIVFTHRLSLACLLRDAHKRYVDAQKSSGSSETTSIKEIALCRIEKRIGLTAGLNTLSGSIPHGLDSLLARLKQAKSKEENSDFSGYQSDVKSICSDMRMLCERTVEEVLLFSIVTRFKRAVTTKDKLHPLTKIQANDCDLIDDLMTRFSVYEHSQPTEIPSTPPTAEELRSDIEKLKIWINEFKKRA